MASDGSETSFGSEWMGIPTRAACLLPSLYPCQGSRLCLAKERAFEFRLSQFSPLECGGRSQRFTATSGTGVWY